MGTIHINPQVFTTMLTGITTVQHKHSKVLRLKRKRQISSLQTAERELLVTCMIPTGHLIPPLLLFRQKNMKHGLMNGTALACIHVHLSSLGVDRERDFHLVFSSFS
jgi:hypothetical protein